MVSEPQPGEEGAQVQVVFSSYQRGQVTLDLIALEPLAWAAGLVPQRMPFSLTMRAPEEAVAYIVSVTAEWAKSCEVISVDVDNGPSGETVALHGPSDQIVLEVVDRLSRRRGGGWGWC